MKSASGFNITSSFGHLTLVNVRAIKRLSNRASNHQTHSKETIEGLVVRQIERNTESRLQRSVGIDPELSDSLPGQRSALQRGFRTAFQVLKLVAMGPTTVSLFVKSERNTERRFQHSVGTDPKFSDSHTGQGPRYTAAFEQTLQAIKDL